MAIEITGRINFDDSGIQETTESVKDLKNEVEEVGKAGENSSKQLNENLKNLKATTDLVGGSVSTLVGGLALLGTENQYIKNFEQATLGAIAFSGGVSKLGRSLVQLSKGTQGATVAQKAFNLVANANPYILAATVLIGVVATLAALRSTLSDIQVEENKLLQTANERLDVIDRQNNTLALQGKTEKEILQTKIDIFEQEVGTEAERRANFEKEKQRIAEETAANKKKAEFFSNALALTLKFLNVPLTLVAKTLDTTLELLNAIGIVSDETFAKIGSLEGFLDSGFAAVADFIFDADAIEEAGQEALAELEKQFDEQENQVNGFKLRLKRINDQEAQENQRRRDEEFKRIQDNEQKVRDFLLNAALQRELALKDELQRELALLELAYAEQIKLAGDNIELRKQLEEDFVAAKAAIDKRINDQIKEDQRLLAEELRFNTLTGRERELEEIETYYEELRNRAAGNAELLAQINQQEKDELAATNQRFRDEDLAAEQFLQDQKVDLVRGGLSAIFDLVGAFAGRSEEAQKRAFNVQKALAIAETTVSTYAAAQAAYRNTIASAAAGDPTATFRAVAAAAIAVTSGLARVAAIARQQFNPGSSATAQAPVTTNASVGAQPITPQFNLFGTGANTIGGPGAQQGIDQFGNQFGPGLIKAFVSETDLTNTTKRLDLIKSGSEL